MYRIPITPMPTPRPRVGKYGAYNPPKYTAYKKSLIQWLSLLKIPQNDYDYIHAIFYVPYPKSTPKKHRINNFPLRTKFDCDNVIKGLCDALEQSNILNDDRCLSGMFIEKLRTTEEKGYIEFELQTIEENPKNGESYKLDI
tara:strand:+ start:506 stop:931 length:426 start_codon:yes stop_codon:yes gene_type:complete